MEKAGQRVSALTEGETNKGTKSCSVAASWIEDCRCLADIEEGRLCGKRRRVAFIYELRIEPTKEGNVV